MSEMPSPFLDVPSEPPALLTPSDLLRLLQISAPTLSRMRQRSDFPRAISIARTTVRWRREEIEAWLESRRVAND